MMKKKQKELKFESKTIVKLNNLEKAKAIGGDSTQPGCPTVVNCTITCNTTLETLCNPTTGMNCANC